MLRWRWAVAASVALFGAQARADGTVAAPCDADGHVCMRAPLAFEHVSAVPIEWGFDTGWVPKSGPLAVHLSGGINAHTKVALSGALVTSWQRDEHGLTAPDVRLAAPGDPGGGLLAYDYGLTLNAEGKIDLKKEIGWSWQGKLPLLGKLDLATAAQGSFDAWGWAPGVWLDDGTKPVPVPFAKLNLVDLFGVPVPGFGGGFELVASMDVAVSWVAERVEITRAGGDGVEGGAITAAAGTSFAAVSGPFVELDVRPIGKVRHEPTLHLMPALYVKVLVKNWNLPFADLPIALPASEKEWTLPAARVHVPLPDVAAPDSVDCGVVPVGGQAACALTVQNLGEARLVGVAAAPSAPFFAATASIALDPKASTSAAVTFAPTRPGSFDALLTLATNDPDNPLKSVLLHGDAPELAPTAPAGEAPAAEAEPLDEAAACGCRTAPTRRSGAPALFVICALAGLAARRARA